MATIVKRVFGLITLLLGVGLFVVGVGQKLLLPDRPFEWGPLVAGLILGPAFFRFGKDWLLNVVDLDVMSVDPASPELAEAKRQAQSSIDLLWTHLGQERHPCFVKFPMETRAGTLEHIWGAVHSRDGDEVVVSLANDPVDEPSGASEQGRHTVSIRDIEDWQVMVSESEIRGGYSVGALARIARSQGYGISRANQQHMAAFVDLEPV